MFSTGHLQNHHDMVQYSIQSDLNCFIFHNLAFYDIYSQK